MDISGHRLPVIEECLRALANCQEAVTSVVLGSHHMSMMTRDEMKAHTHHDLALRLAILLVDDAEITEGIVWAHRTDPDDQGEVDTEFTARTVVMKASTYHNLCQALRHLRTEALEDNRIKP